MSSHSEQLQAVREMVRQHLSMVVGLTGAAQWPAKESLVIRDGYFQGRRFDAGPVSALWLHEDATLQFFDGSGSPTVVLPLGQDDVVKRRAA
ncbi:MAG: hypothetical protein AAFP90_04020 [Planctomycetota bacterium]